MGVFFNLSLKIPLEQKVARPGLRCLRRRSARWGRHPYFRSVVLDTSAPASSVIFLVLVLYLLFVLSGFIRRWMPYESCLSARGHISFSTGHGACQELSIS